MAAVLINLVENWYTVLHNMEVWILWLLFTILTFDAIVCLSKKKKNKTKKGGTPFGTVHLPIFKRASFVLAWRSLPVELQRHTGRCADDLWFKSGTDNIFSVLCTGFISGEDDFKIINPSSLSTQRTIVYSL